LNLAATPRIAAALVKHGAEIEPTHCPTATILAQAASFGVAYEPLQERIFILQLHLQRKYPERLFIPTA
jgi:hypothetical protein